MTAAVAAWETQIDGLNINHSTTSCSEAQVELDWVTHLDGSLATTRQGLSGPLFIRFAKKYSASGADIPWSFDGSPAEKTPSYSGEFDFRATAIHEIGHALGLKHPEVGTSEGNEYQWKSWDGQTPTMKAGGVPGSEGLGRRTLKQDDRAGGWWSGTYDQSAYGSNARQYFPSPDQRKYWKATGGSLNSCGTGYYCLSVSQGSNQSFMWNGTRITTDSRSIRQSPLIDVKWKLANPVSNTSKHIRIRFAYRTVNKDKTTSSLTYVWDDVCPNTNSGWQNCLFSPVAPDRKVQDFLVYVYNYTGGTIHIAYVRSHDGP